ncbi:thioredoxin-like protein 4B [Parasteatoda tepidariorum]|uniref:thioredoxin-like protein 4B n=1 Tax=Parasteatoda tepidariorum TaxID=114398 RepID=UPI00077FC075|nr:thioredoxin-like protein 4B [Parasteatoda tepidariorum]
MSILRHLKTKKEVDDAIRTNEEKVLVLRFGNDNEIGCLQIDDIMSRCAVLLSEMAIICTINLEDVPEYVEYFDISHIPATIFFFNSVPIKIDSGTDDNTKFVGPFQCKQDFIDLVEVVYRGAMRGKHIVNCPIDRRRISNYQLLFKDF